MKKLLLAVLIAVSTQASAEVINITKWSCNTGNTNCSLTTDDPQIVSANFLPNTGTLVINEVDANGVLGSYTESGKVEYGTPTKLTTYNQVKPFTVNYASGTVLAGQVSQVKNPRTGGWTANWWFSSIFMN